MRRAVLAWGFGLVLSLGLLNQGCRSSSNGGESGTDAGDGAGVSILPSDRSVPWMPGIAGGIPNYPLDKTACNSGCDYTTHGDDAIDDSAILQSCLANTAQGHACVVKAGTYAIMTPISVPSNRVLRGAGEGLTNLHNRHDGGTTVLLGGAGWFGAYGAGDTGVVALSSGYTKGSTTLVSVAQPAATSAAFAIGAYVAVTENNDPNLVNVTGYDGDCNWCGGPWGFGSGTQLMAQIVQVTAISGNTVTIDRPLYYTFTSSLSPVLKPLNLPVVGAGVEDLTIQEMRATAEENHGLVHFSAAVGCWAKGVELVGAYSEFVEFQWSRGCVLRDSYIHDPQSTMSGQGYGAHVTFWNSDHLVENNIFVKSRHSMVFEGGGSGCVFGYNYSYRDWQGDSDSVWLGKDIVFHGAHPYMNLIEGNMHQEFVPDNTWGSSSHNTYFRNNATGASDFAAVATEATRAVTIDQNNWYFNVVGNVLGSPGTSLVNGPLPGCSENEIWQLGCKSEVSGPADPNVMATLFHCGNYSYASSAGASAVSGFASSLPGVDGDCSGTLPNSYYYSSKPSWFGSCPWPPIGPDVNGYAVDIPAKRMCERGAYTAGCP